MANPVEIPKPSDILDVIFITDHDGVTKINLRTGIAALEVWYYTRAAKDSPFIKFSSVDNKDGYKNFVKTDDYNYSAYIEGEDSLDCKTGEISASVYVALTNADLAKGYFRCIGAKKLGISLVSNPMEELLR